MWLELTEVCGTDFERPFEFDCAAKPLNNEHPTPRHTIPISVQFLTEKAVRLVLRPNPEVVGVDSSPLGLPYDEYSRDTNVDINSEDETVKLDTEGISASVATDTASFTLSYDNKRILDTNIDVTNNRGELSVPTIGYKENIVDNYPLEVVQTGFSTALDPAESIFGLGEQFTTFEKSGSRVEASVSQAHGTNSNDTYAPVPFFYLIVATAFLLRRRVMLHSTSGAIRRMRRRLMLIRLFSQLSYLQGNHSKISSPHTPH